MPKPYYYSRYTVDGLVQGGIIGASTSMILEEAERLGINWKILPGTMIIELEWQGKKEYFRFQIPSTTTDVGFYSCLDKSVTNNLLQAAGVSVPRGFNLTRQDPPDYHRRVFEALAKPLVVKPTHGNQGNGITVGVSEWETYQKAVQRGFEFLNDRDAGVIVEEMFTGQEYRILATREKVVGILYRRPANVVGDGHSTIGQLIETKNSDPRRGEDDTFTLFKIKIDDEVKTCLAEGGVSLETVLEKDRMFFLRKVSNIAKGGDSIDVTDEAHPSVKEIAVKAMQALPGLAWAGVDFMTQDITQPQTPDSYRIIEVNSSPGFCVQEEPFAGTPRNGKRAFLELVFPGVGG